MERAALIVVFSIVCGWPLTASAQPDQFEGLVAGPKFVTLCVPQRTAGAFATLPKQSKLVPLRDLTFIGPRSSHPFVLGNFAADGQWGLVNGSVGLIDGKNAALQLAWAGDFELAGVIEQTGLGGCFWLLGWEDGRGYALHNVVMKDSGSPWFLSEFRGGTAIEDRTIELEKFDWKGDQSFVMTVQDKTLALQVGQFPVVKSLVMDSYQPGQLAFGVYDTRYGPKNVRIKALRIRSLEPRNKTPAAGNKE